LGFSKQENLNKSGLYLFIRLFKLTCASLRLEAEDLILMKTLLVRVAEAVPGEEW
jgi:hypothetical protein